MRFTRAAVTAALAAIFLAGLTAQAQAPAGSKHFSKDGLEFDYPESWALEDQSTSDAQQLTLGRAGSDAQIRVFVHRGKVETPEKLAQAKKAFIDPYIAATNNQFVEMGGKPERSDATTQVGGAEAQGVRLRASLGGEAGEAAIYWLTLGNRVVVLTFFGPDQALKKDGPAWDSIRNSLRVVAPTPAPEKPKK